MLAVTTFMRRIAVGMNVASAVLLLGMVLVTLADVAARATFAATRGSVDFTFRGSVELVSYGLLLLVFFTFPHSIRQAQVVVEMFTDRFGPRVSDVLEGGYTVCLALLSAVLAWRFHDSAGELALSGETTQDLLIPLGFIHHAVSFACAVLAVRAVLEGLSLLAAKENAA